MIISPLQNTAILRSVWLQKRPKITQHFGENPDLYDKFGLSGHNGTDFRAKEGTPVFAPISGEIKVKKSSNGYGLHIKIRDHKNEVVLAHLSKTFFQDGAKVRMGDIIAETGNTGFSTGPHLHMGLRQLKPSKDVWKADVKNYNNGFLGWLNVEPYMITFKGTVLKNTL